MRIGIVGLVLAAAALLWWGLRPNRVERADRVETVVERRVVERNVPARDALPPVDLASADRERDLIGVVVRKLDGKPVAGARLTVISEPWRRVQLRVYPREDVRVEGPTTVSASDGSFSLRLERDRNYALRVEKEGFAVADWTHLRRGERARIELEQGSSITIRVLDPDNAPVPGARIFVLCWDDGRRERYEGGSDAAGEATWTRTVMSEWVTIEVEHPERGYLLTNRRWPDGSEPIIVAYEPGCTLTGRVVDATTRQPIAGARVGHWPNLAGAVVAGASGEFRLPGWTGKRSRVLCAEAPGYATYGVRVGDEDDVEIALPAGGSIVGRVVDAQKRPVTGARAILQSVNRLGRDSIVQERRCVSDADGRIRFDGVAVNTGPIFRGHKLHVQAPGHARFELKVAAFRPDEPKDVGDLQLVEPHSVHVVVRRGDEPVARERAWLQGPLDPDAEPGELPTSEHVRTDDLGRARFGDLAPGRYRFTVRLDAAPGVNELIEVAEREERREFELPKTRQVEITVVDETGAPAHQWLRLYARHERVSVSSRVAQDGTATLHLTPEMGHVWLQDLRNRQSGPALKFPVEPGQSELRIVHTSKVAIHGVVVDELGKPIDAPSLRAFREGRSVGRARGNPKGEFSLWVPSGGPCRLEVYGRMRLGRMKSVAPGAKDLRIIVREEERDRKIRIRAVDPEGRLLAGVMVGRKTGLSRTTDENGLREFGQLPFMMREFGGFDPSGRFAHPEPVFALPEGQAIELRFRRGRSFRVRLTEKGKPVASGHCSASTSGVHANLKTDADGWLTLTSPEGSKDRYQISVRRNQKQLNVFVTPADDGQSFDVRDPPKR